MSVRTMAKVWESSQHNGTGLLMLLAIADFADDDGKAYPAVLTLAAKCRMRARNCQYLLRELEKSGELSVIPNAGPNGANLYRVNLASLGVQHSAGVQSLAGVQHSARGGAKDCAEGVQPIAPKPSVNHQEPPTRAKSASKSGGDEFAAFWAAYPKKVGKSAAMKAWGKVKVGGLLLPDLMAALGKQKASRDWQKDGGQFIPHPATWLNGRRWEDESTDPENQAAQSPADNPLFRGAL